MRLLIVTQTVDTRDSILGFFVRWIEEFAKHAERVEVICLQEGMHNLPANVHIHSLGKPRPAQSSQGIGTRMRYAARFLSLIWGLRNEYDAVFVHMNPEYIVLGGPFWRLRGTRIALWYTHKNVDLKLRIAAAYANVIFTASKESFRLHSGKVRVMGHGIDADFFSPDATVARGDWWLSAGRLNKSKRHDLVIRMAAQAGKELRIIGEGPERGSLEALARELGVRATFLGGLSHLQVRDEFRRAGLFLHTSETGSLDKIILEAVACGCPVTTRDPALKYLETADPTYVREQHSLHRLIPAIVGAIQGTTPRVAFLFTNSKEKVISDMRTGKDADTVLHGMNHITGAEHFTVPPQSIRSLLFVPRLLQYDFVIAQDNFLLGYVVSLCSRVFHLKTRWLYTAVHSSTLMRRHATHPIRLFLFKKFWSSYACIICISSGQLEDFVRLGIPRERLVFVPFGVDARFFRSAAASRGEDLIVSAGRDAGRDYPTLFRAAERVEYPFIVVASHRNIPSGMPVPANVSVHYDRSLAELRDLYARARLVVVASKDASRADGSDCSGQTVILDALAVGKAVIATHRSWITDYFVPGQDLVVVPPNDPEVLAQAINSLWQDAEKRERLAASGHAKVVVQYTTKAFAGALEKLMDSLI